MNSCAAALCALAQRHGEVGADFVMVYLSEAHASDEWPIGLAALGIEVRAHRCLAERRSAAEAMLARLPLREHGFTVCLDLIGKKMEDCEGEGGGEEDNPFDRAMPSWPFRFWVVQHGRIALRANLKNGGKQLDLSELEHWLEQ
jgi:hypothetical protein